MKEGMVRVVISNQTRDLLRNHAIGPFNERDIQVVNSNQVSILLGTEVVAALHEISDDPEAAILFLLQGKRNQ